LPAKAAEAECKREFLFGVTPVKWRANPTAPWAALGAKPGVYKRVPKGVWMKIVDVMGEVGNITNMDAATFIRIDRVGTSKNTEYEVLADTETLRKPASLLPATREAIQDAMRPGGGCDLFRFVARDLKSYGEISAALSGVKIEDDGPPERGAHVIEDAQDSASAPAPDPVQPPRPAPAKTTPSMALDRLVPAVTAPVPPAVVPVAALPQAPATAVSKAAKRLASELAAKPPKTCFSLDHAYDAECRACEFQEPCAFLCGHELKAAAVPVVAAVAKKAEPASKPAPVDDGMDELDRELEAASRK